MKITGLQNVINRYDVQRKNADEMRAKKPDKDEKIKMSEKKQKEKEKPIDPEKEKNKGVYQKDGSVKKEPVSNHSWTA